MSQTSDEPRPVTPSPPSTEVGSPPTAAGSPPAAIGVRPPPAPRAGGRSRQARLVIRKVSPWSVFKVSLLFYTCVLAIVLLSLVILWAIAGAMGVITKVTDLAQELFAQDFRVDGMWLFGRAIALGVANVVLWSCINVFVAFLYNLISDVVGGVEVTLGEGR